MLLLPPAHRHPLLHPYTVYWLIYMVRYMVRDDIAYGERPHCAMTRSSGGFRPIHDGRHLSKFQLDLPFNMESLYEFIEQLRQGDRMFVIDITSAHHRPPLLDSDHLHLHVAGAL